MLHAFAYDVAVVSGYLFMQCDESKGPAADVGPVGCRLQATSMHWLLLLVMMLHKHKQHAPPCFHHAQPIRLSLK